MRENCDRLRTVCAPMWLWEIYIQHCSDFEALKIEIRGEGELDPA